AQREQVGRAGTGPDEPHLAPCRGLGWGVGGWVSGYGLVWGSGGGVGPGLGWGVGGWASGYGLAWRDYGCVGPGLGRVARRPVPGLGMAALALAGHSLPPRRVRRPGTNSVDRYGAGPVTSAAGRMSSPGRPRLAPCTAPSSRPASRTASSTSGR